MGEMTFKSRVTLTLLVRGAMIGIGLLSSVVTARWLGPEGRGLLATLSVITGLVLQFGNLGLHSGNVYYVSKEPRATSSVLGNSLWLSLFLGGLGALAAAAAGWARPAWFPGVSFTLIVVAAAALPFHFMLLLFQNCLLGMQEVKAFNVFESANKTLTFFALAVYLVLLGGGAGGAVVLFAVTSASFAVAAVLYCRRLVPFGLRLDPALFRRMFGFGGKVYLSCLMSFVVLRSDMLLVNYYCGSGQAGVYSIAVQIADTLLLVPMTIGMLLFPRIAVEQADRQEEVTARVIRHTALLLGLLCAAAWVLVGPVVSILYGPRFGEAAVALRWLAPGIWAVGLNGVLMNHFGGQGMPWVTVAAPCLGAVLNVLLNLLLLPHYGIVGAAAASTVAYLAMATVGFSAFLKRRGGGLRESLVIAPEEIMGLLGLRRG
jgi:O-antigen/teichoic acid export membrane protein